MISFLLLIIILLIIQQGRCSVATKQQVLDAIAAEKAQVAASFTAAMQLIQELKDQIAQGQAATPADLDEIEQAVSDIFTPIQP